jgi:uncharacterized protein involved in exopolysaccharide biosynthesis
MSDETPNNGNLINFIATTVETMRDQMVTMRDQMVTMRDQMATMGDQMATKGDIARLEDKLRVESTAIRGDIEQVQLRLDSIDKTLRARLDEMEGEIARLRSVVYLLAKDRPELLRLLGQSPSTGESHP